ncbi:flagellar hook-length control protein FliK [Paracoccus salsus]|uniref:flagellar hook-length control protein FliK n=1 Tax=Paracoccus salsus TaxID=2911061 RepID=UPI001F2FBE88|nr:flagellar hook-length control protein FliK [Paracoccus salsus]MCF3974240.1 flagellar hook-length control protein FliK [Paracoccus salsus]
MNSHSFIKALPDRAPDSAQARSGTGTAQSEPRRGEDFDKAVTARDREAAPRPEPGAAPAAEEQATDSADGADVVADPPGDAEDAVAAAVAPVPDPDATVDRLTAMLESWSGVSAAVAEDTGGEEAEMVLAAPRSGPGNIKAAGAAPMAEMDPEATMVGRARSDGDAETPDSVRATRMAADGAVEAGTPARTDAPANRPAVPTAVASGEAAAGMPSDSAGSDALLTATATGARAETARIAFAQHEWRPVQTPPQTVIRQIADAVVTTSDNRIEIALSPEELGRVRLVVTGADRAAHVTVWIERPEVMDLVRRNAGLLLQHLGDAGLDGAALEFRQEEGRSQDRQSPLDQPGGDPEALRDAAWPIARHAVHLAATGLSGDRRLDIRL